MTLPTRRPERRAVTASAARLTRRDSEYRKRLQQPWQTRALRYYDDLGEIRFACQFYAKMLAKVRYFPARLLPDGTKEPIDSGLPVELLNRVQDPGGGRTLIQRDYGKLMFVTGEGVLLVTGEDSPEEKWRFLWREEIKVNDDGTAVRLDAQGQPTGESGTAYRMWTPHPKHSDLPDSPMRSVLDICEELLILTASVRSTATTRLTNGLMKMASELSPAPDDAGSDEDPMSNPLLEDMVAHFQSQIENPGSPESMVPFIFEGAYDYLEKGLEWVKLHDPATDYMERDLRTEAVTRLALSLDFPPEELRGMTDANHWTAQQVMYARWTEHGKPMAAQFGSDLSQAYHRPALRDAGYQGWQDVVIDMDDSQVVVNPDRTTTANDAIDRMAIGFPGYRTLTGIPESMAPTDEDKKILALIKARDIPGLEDALGIVNKRGPTPALQNGAQPGTPPAPTDGRVVSRQESRTAAVVGAAELALRQCRAKAGARLRSWQSCQDCKTKTDGLPNSLVAAAIGEQQVLALGVKSVSGLVAGGADEFRWSLVERGLSNHDAEMLAQRVEFYAAKSLFEDGWPSLPPGFVAQVEQAWEVADSAIAA